MGSSISAWLLLQEGKAWDFEVSFPCLASCWTWPSLQTQVHSHGLYPGSASCFRNVAALALGSSKYVSVLHNTPCRNSVPYPRKHLYSCSWSGKLAKMESMSSGPTQEAGPTWEALLLVEVGWVSFVYSFRDQAAETQGKFVSLRCHCCKWTFPCSCSCHMCWHLIAQSKVHGFKPSPGKTRIHSREGK